MPKPDRLTILGFIAVIIFWGANSFAIKFMTVDTPPFRAAALRYLLATAVFMALALARRERFPRGRELVFIIGYGAFLFGASTALYYWGLGGMSAGLATIIFSVAPLLTLLVAAAHGEETLRLRPLLGALLALFGVALAFSQEAGGGTSLLAAAAIFFSALLTAETTIMARRKLETPPLMINAVAAAAGTVTLWLISLLAGEAGTLTLSPASGLVLLYLAIPGTVFTYFIYMLLVRRWSASAASYAFVLTPFTAIAVEMLAGARPNLLFLVGGVIVLLGVWYGALSGTPTEPEPRPASSPRLGSLSIKEPAE